MYNLSLFIVTFVTFFKNKIKLKNYYKCQWVKEGGLGACMKCVNTEEIHCYERHSTIRYSLLVIGCCCFIYIY